uniref:DUF3715 domain-containing protein n=1 Tax=Macrostomum lignano TaxID=282301 RepID=A0A1I8FKM2_9PLAT
MLENGGGATLRRKFFREAGRVLARQGLAQDELSTHYGFLAAASEELVDLTLREGLKVRFCPINSLGYCISGVHLCVHGDVCLQEAALETGDDGEQIVLVAFKFMFGRTRRVTPVTPKDMAIIAPSPGFNCHIPDVRPGRTDSLSDQYLRSLAYLYEFENSFYHPVVPGPASAAPGRSLPASQARQRSSTETAAVSADRRSLSLRGCHGLVGLVSVLSAAVNSIHASARRDDVDVGSDLSSQ